MPQGHVTVALPGTPAADQPVAVIVVHGIGQQVPFETLEGLAESLRAAQQCHASGEKPEACPVTVRMVELGGRELPRAELTLSDGDRGTQAVHVYEAYWAPLTEGKVTLAEVTRFLYSAGWGGVKLCFSSPTFSRWMFQKWQDLTYQRVGTVLVLLLAVAVFSGLVGINAAVAAVTAGRLAKGGISHWPSNALIADLSLDLLLVSIPIVLLVLLLQVNNYLQRKWRKAGLFPTGRAGGALAALRPFTWIAVALVFLGVIAGAVLMGVHLASGGAARGVWWPASWLWPVVESWPHGTDGQPQLRTLPVLFIWGLTVAASAVVRSYVLQYVGDVAAYVSAHTLSRFYEVRKAIQQEALAVFRAVYSASGASEGEFLYSRVLVVGHSLGSVVAYDTLNALVREDARRAGLLHVLERTPLFLTFGSPLDKTAFIFRTQTAHTDEIREALAAAVQAMIVDYALRPARWINLWSREDFISGRLDFYDEKGGSNPVVNLQDASARTPLLAHNEYWRGPLLAYVLYYAALGKLQPGGALASGAPPLDHGGLQMALTE